MENHAIIGRLERVPLREVWRREAGDFTTWLEQNLDVLNEELDVPLVSADREQTAGAFSVDLLAEDVNGDRLVIENQLERSDHDHLGKLITYLAFFGAQKAIWIVSDPRPEHVRAISWLNESAAEAFYLLKAEAIRIGSSEPALLLTKIVGPSVEARQIGEQKKELAERHLLRERFWAGLLEVAKTKTRLHAGVSPTHSNGLGAGAGRAGFGYFYWIWKDRAAVALIIDRGAEFEDFNRIAFEYLLTHRQQIEAAYGASLEWDMTENRRRCHIRHVVTPRGYAAPEEEWPQIHEDMANAMARLEGALAPHVRAIPDPAPA